MALGAKLAFDADLIVPDKDKDPAQGRGSRPGPRAPRRSTPRPCRRWRGTTTSRWTSRSGSLPDQAKKVILHGSDGEKIRFIYDDNARKYEVNKTFEGVLPNLERRWRENRQLVGPARNWAATSRRARARPATAIASSQRRWR